MNPLIVIVGAGIAVTGLFLNSNKKDLTTKEKGSKNAHTDHAKSVPAEKHNETKLNKNISDPDSNKPDNVDDLGNDEKSE